MPWSGKQIRIALFRDTKGEADSLLFWNAITSNKADITTSDNMPNIVNYKGSFTCGRMESFILGVGAQSERIDIWLLPQAGNDATMPCIKSPVNALQTISTLSEKLLQHVRVKRIGVIVDLFQSTKTHHEVGQLFSKEVGIPVSNYAHELIFHVNNIFEENTPDNLSIKCNHIKKYSTSEDNIVNMKVENGELVSNTSGKIYSLNLHLDYNTNQNFNLSTIGVSDRVPKNIITLLVSSIINEYMN